MKRSKILLFGIIGLLIVSLLVSIAGCAAQGSEPLPPMPRLRVATTTSLYDTGLWGYLEPMFEEKYNVELDILSLGSGAAFEYAKRGTLMPLLSMIKPMS